MKGEVVAVVLLFLTVHLCEAGNVIIGSTKKLVCNNQNGNSWDKFNRGNNLWGIINDGGSYSGSQSNTLTITNFQIEDSGYFRCKVDGNIVTGETQLKPEVQGSIGSPVTLTCTVSGMELYWYIIENNSQRTLTDNDKYEGSRTISLKIKSLTANTAAVYYCRPLNGQNGPEITVSISEVTGWSSWNEWSACSASCGNGQRQRLRTCSGGSCAGSPVQNEDCTVDFGVDGMWSAWSTSGTCTQSCGGGTQPGVRLCNNPTPKNCGLYCNGKDNDNIVCSTFACPVNGGWSLWGSWGACTSTCGDGQQSRGRTCDNPAPENSGTYCEGQGSDYYSCTLPACPVNGGWSSWDSWGVCNVTCGTGQQSRRRICNNPAQANGGANCQGGEYDYNSCTQPACPVNGGWSSWTSGPCNGTCGTGQQRRRRYCNNPLKENGGADCQGEETDLVVCALSVCAGDNK